MAFSIVDGVSPSQPGHRRGAWFTIGRYVVGLLRGAGAKPPIVYAC